MLSAEPARLTDDLWLAAHDSVNGRPQVSDLALGRGLAAGLLAELVYGKLLELRQGELFRTVAETDDVALRPVLARMEAEEAGTVAAVRPSARRASMPAASEQAFHDWPAQSGYGLGLPPPGTSGAQRAVDAWGPRPGQEAARHSRSGHDLQMWLKYLSDEQRAEKGVIERLSRAGLVRLRQIPRWLRRPEVAYLPADSVAAANPANKITTALQHRHRLERSQLCLAGLILATGLHHHAFATLNPDDRSYLSDALKRRLDAPTRELLRAVDVAVGEAAMR